MIKSRVASRLLLGMMVLWNLLVTSKRKPGAHPRRILIAHHLLIGDTVMLTPLLAKLRQHYPATQIVMTVRPGMAVLYQTQPYGVEALPYDPSLAHTLLALWSQRGFDLAIVPGDNRFSWSARGLGAKWIVAFAGDRPAYKSWFVDVLIPYPSDPATWGDMVAELIPGASPRPYRSADWPGPTCTAVLLLPTPYAILHVGASSALKLWPPEKWRALAVWFQEQGFYVVWTGALDERHLIDAVDPEHVHPFIVGVSLAHLWCYIAKAAIVVCPDTGVAHLARIIDTPVVVLYGPGSPILCGAGQFWQNSYYAPVTIEDFPCRDQNRLFKRELPWVRRCGRGLHECASPACMHAITIMQVQQAIMNLLSKAKRQRQIN